MIEQGQVKALAELDGRELLVTPQGLAVEKIDGVFCAPRQVNYLHSYDAIIRLIQKQPSDIRSRIGSLLLDCAFGSFGQIAIHLFSKTPSQLSEALLRATGKWKE